MTRADLVAHRARAAVARDDEFGAQTTVSPFGVATRSVTPATSWSRSRHIVGEHRAGGLEPRQALEQRSFKARLIEGAERGVPVGAARRLHLHERTAARVQVDDLRVRN